MRIKGWDKFQHYKAGERKPTWIKLHRSILDDFDIHCLSASEFVKKLEACVLLGEENEFSKHVKPGHDRPAASEWLKIRAEIFARDDYTCRYCGKRGGKLECDHIYPVARGGDHHPENLATACFSCNRSKRDKTLEEWRGAA